MDRIEKSTQFSMPLKSCDHNQASTSFSLQGRHSRRLMVLMLLIFVFLAICGTLSACSGSSPTETKENALVVTPSASDTIKETAAQATPEPTDIPAVTYTFDLTEEEIVDPDYQLAFISNPDRAVIFGGEYSPYFIEGKFACSGVDSMWSPATSMSFQLTSAIYRFAYSIDKTSVAFVVRKENPVDYSLMYFDGTESSEVSPDSEYFCISSDGSSVAYILDDTLYVWNASSKESVLITDDATSNFVLSPTGKYVGYAKGDNYTSYIAPVGGYSLEIGSSCYPVALTDDGSVFYYYDASSDETAFCVFSSGSPRVLDDDAVIEQRDYPAHDSNLVFNRDCTQVVYRDGEDFFFSMNGGDPVKATGGSVVDANEKYYVDDSFVRIQIAGIKYIAPYYVDNKNLCNLLFQNGDTLSFFDENLKVFTIPVSEYSEGVLSGNGKALSYLAIDRTVDPPTEEFTFVTDFSDPESNNLLFSDLHAWFILTTDAGNLYYCNDVGQLFVIRGDEEPVKLDTYVCDFNIMTVGDTSYVYYLKDESSYTYTLCRIEDAPGAKPEVIDTDVVDMDICDAGLVYYKNEVIYDPGSSSMDIYFAQDGLNGDFIFTMEYFDY